MASNDYVVVFDETGQPYIAHFSISGAYGAAKNKVGSVYNAARAKAAGVKNYGAGRGVRANHKYIAKIGNRYIYDAKELAAVKTNKGNSMGKNVTKNSKNLVNNTKSVTESSVSSRPTGRKKKCYWNRKADIC